MKNCIAIGLKSEPTEDFEIVCNFAGIGVFRTVMSPEEYAVMSVVLTRMLAPAMTGQMNIAFGMSALNAITTGTYGVPIGKAHEIPR